MPERNKPKSLVTAHIEHPARHEVLAHTGLFPARYAPVEAAVVFTPPPDVCDRGVVATLLPSPGGQVVAMNRDCAYLIVTALVCEVT